MSWRVIVRPQAEADMREAAQWYEAQRPYLGGQFLDEAGRVVSLLESSPERHPLYYRGFRRVLMRIFPCKVFYRIERREVIIVRVLHIRRDHRLHL